MRATMRPNAYRRMILNEWVNAESAFIEMREWDACVDPGLQPLQSDRNLPIYLAVDASLKRDSTAIVAVTTDGERVRLVAHRIFQPSPDQPLDFEATIEAEIIDLCSRFSVQAVRFDPWQMASSSQRLIKRGVPMEEFPQTSGNLTDSSSNLYELIKACNLQVYPDEAMRLSISQAIAVETPRGWRIAKEKAKHKIDVVVALAMASLAAVKQQPMPGWGIFEHYRRQSEAVTNGKPTAPTLQQEHGHYGFMQGIAPKPIGDAVRIIMPPGQQPSQLIGASGLSYNAHPEGADWVLLRLRGRRRRVAQEPEAVKPRPDRREQANRGQSRQASRAERRIR
jgi:hypothetical protein